VYVWQQHVCAAARRGRDGVWGGEGDRSGDLPPWFGRLRAWVGRQYDVDPAASCQVHLPPRAPDSRHSQHEDDDARVV